MRKKTVNQITLKFDLLGNDNERMAQYRWLKELEKTTLPAYIQAFFQCNAPDDLQLLAYPERKTE